MKVPFWVRKRIQKKRREQPGGGPGPAVPPQVVKAYLEREREDWDWLKAEPRWKLLRLVEEEGYEFYTKPFKHQLVCFLIGILQSSFLFFLDMGAGKSKLILDLVRYYKKKYGSCPTLILVPSPVNTQAWVDEIAEHAPDLKAVQMIGNTWERADQVEEDADLFLMNYHGLMLLICTEDERKKKDRSNKEKAHKIHPKLSEVFASRFRMVVFDESHKLGNNQSLFYRMCKSIGKYIDHRYALTGTPFGKDPIKLWAQFDIVDRGETLGLMGLFKAAFFIAKEGYFGGLEYKFDKSKEKKLNLVIKNKSIRYEDEEFADLPPVQHQIKRYVLPEEAEEYYRRYLQILRKAKGENNIRELESSYLRMRQIASGFLNVRVDDEKSVIEFPYNPRLELLESLIDEIPEGRKVIIFNHFVRSGTYITNMLTKKKIKWSRLGGKTKDPVNQIRRFQEDPEYTALVMQPGSGGAGLNPQKVANYGIYYESPSDPINRKQTWKRLVRTGQPRRVWMTDIVCATTGSLDSAILASLKNDEDLFDAICSGRRSI